MNLRRTLTLLLAATLMTSSLSAGTTDDSGSAPEETATRDIEYQLKAGFNIGGTAPLPLPREIRSINSYSPSLALSFEVDAHKRFGSSPWGFTIGMRFENKAMNTRATVKNYHMEMTADDGGYMEGAWTGKVRTKVRLSYVTIPILATYDPHPRWRLYAGPYFSFATDREFTGSANDGYLRHGNPTGEKAYVERATYDFSDDVRNFNWGVQLGGEWSAFKQFKLYADLNWGINSIFPNDFESITFDLYPIYANVGFAYVF